MAGLRGLSNVIRNLNTMINMIEGKSLDGLIEAGILIMNDTENTPPKTPVDTGNLRASRFIVTSAGKNETRQLGKRKKFKGKGSSKLTADHNSAINKSKAVLKKFDLVSVRIGFSASYAPFVHEMAGVSDVKIGKKKQISPLSKSQRQSFGQARFRRPGSGSKFLEASLKRNTVNALKIIAKRAKIR